MIAGYRLAGLTIDVFGTVKAPVAGLIGADGELMVG
jgi:hypothetical protein